MPSAVNNNSNEKLDHFHFGPLFSDDDASFVREHSKFI